MTVHFFTKGDFKLGDSRQRAFKIAEELNARGFAAVVHAPPILEISMTRWPRKALLIWQVLKSLPSIKKNDIIFLQRSMGNKYFFLIMTIYIKLFRRKMIFDYDDAIYLDDPFKVKTFTRMASAVFVCSRALKKWAEQYNNNVHIFHTTVKLSDYEPFTKQYTDEAHPVVIGWIGTARYHYDNLAILRPVFERLVTESKVPLVFKLVGVWGFPKIKELFADISGLSCEFVEYTPPEGVAETIQTFDIGVNPLALKDEWNMSRSSYKPYEYMACGLAQITSAVGEITFVVKDGENGFLADSTDEWVSKLKLLIEDPMLRKTLGQGGQATIRTEEGYDVALPRMIRILQGLGGTVYK